MRAFVGVAESLTGAASLQSFLHAAAGAGASVARRAPRLSFCCARRCRFFSLMGSLTPTLTSRPCRVSGVPAASEALAEADWAKTILPHPAWLSPRGSGASQASSTGPNRPSKTLLSSRSEASQATFETKTASGGVEVAEATQRGAARAACRVQCDQLGEPTGGGSCSVRLAAATKKTMGSASNDVDVEPNEIAFACEMLPSESSMRLFFAEVKSFTFRPTQTIANEH